MLKSKRDLENDCIWITVNFINNIDLNNGFSRIFFLSCLCPCLLAQVCKSFIWSLVQNLLKLITIVFTHRMSFPDHLHHFIPQAAWALSWSGGGMLWDEHLPQLQRVEHKGPPSWSLQDKEEAMEAPGIRTLSRGVSSFWSLLCPRFAYIRSLQQPATLCYLWVASTL